MGCCKSGGTPGGGSGTNSLAEDPNTPTDPSGTPIGKDGSKGGTVPYYGSPGGAPASTINAGGPYVAAGSEQALGKSSKISPANKNVPKGIGGLSERYESNGNPGAIYHDVNSTNSYGKYQINTGTGTMNNFLEYEKQNNPSAYQNLMSAGGGSLEGQQSTAFQNAWKTEAANDPAFSSDQDGFIQSTHYDPAVTNIKNATGLDVSTRSLAVQQVVWSTAVQNGPNTSIFKNALAGKDVNSMSDSDIINSIYDERGKTNASGNLAYFSSSSKSVQNSISNRYVTERQTALSEVPT